MSAQPQWGQAKLDPIPGGDSHQVSPPEAGFSREHFLIDPDTGLDPADELEALFERQRNLTTTDRDSFLHKLSREPLVHFLLAGAVLFSAGTLFSRASGSAAQNRIQVSAAEIDRLRDVWSRQYGRTPNATQLRNLIDEYVREEVFYREAIASGLDKDDTIIRRRVVEKMEFLSQEIASAPPSESELQAYFDANREKFIEPAQVAFEHIYFSPAKRGAAENDARKALGELRRHPDKGSRFGDGFMLQSEYPAQTQSEIKALFGDEFANELFHFSAGQWEGPISSSYGVHLVRISQYIPSRLPELAEVRNQVLTEFKNERLQRAGEAYYQQLRKKYHVEVDGKAVAQTESQPPGQPVSRGANLTAPDED